MKPNYNVWILMKYKSESEKDIIGVFFNRESAETAKANLSQPTGYVIRAADAFDSGY